MTAGTVILYAPLTVGIQELDTVLLALVEMGHNDDVWEASWRRLTGRFDDQITHGVQLQFQDATVRRSVADAFGLHHITRYGDDIEYIANSGTWRGVNIYIYSRADDIDIDKEG